ncbi:carboxypeptidase-like regulatory domain-containing protein [Paraflavitalea speifideaquila]|uniref:carboxypeptidase-like regulatory domain-containing protein n=1 Tax=Paraflavitalea speifideaquila TaxID=3076558 RepID=UPI0028E958AA|nr:carboxypeptidase-like regulatory domain-containing protein [Paraflavitalea speifideiaquila]
MLRSTIRLLSLIITLLTFHEALQAQAGKPLTISGYVRDANNGEVLINATINVSPVGASVQTNAYGYFSITLPAGKYTVNVSYTGYSLDKIEIDLTASKTLEVALKTAAAEMDQVVVTGEKNCVEPIP